MGVCTDIFLVLFPFLPTYPPIDSTTTTHSCLKNKKKKNKKTAYAYLDGELHVKVSLAMDAIIRDLTKQRKVGEEERMKE